MSGSLSASWLGARTGLDPGRLETLRRRGDLLAVLADGEYVYPPWQFGRDGEPLPSLPRVLATARAAGVSDERLVELLGARAGLSGDRFLGDALRDGNVEHVLSVVLAAAR
ncbi:MAG TPA: hypothetical protein VF094_04800 [Gaiellaceae bacterium]